MANDRQPIAAFVAPEELVERLDDPKLLLVDCRFRLTDPDWGQAAFRSERLPSAVYADLDRDLAKVGAPGGRHPLPDEADFVRFLNRIGLGPERRVVVYDDGAGAIAARAWWLLRHVGLRDVRILSGGMNDWQGQGLPTDQGEPQAPSPGRWNQGFGAMPTVDSDRLTRELEVGDRILVDARAAERFRGEQEPLDRRAGHIPGAINRPFSDNLDQRGRVLEPARLRSEWLELLGDSKTPIAHMCGSGVTACHNLAAAEYAGLGTGALFVESWSGWIEDPARPVIGPSGAGD